LFKCITRGNAVFSMSRQVAINSNGDLMPQIWMTYGELAGLMECGLSQASDHVHSEHLDRKRSRDGHVRVKLNLTLMELFVARIRAAADQPLDQAIHDLRGLHALMQRYEERDQRASGSATEPGDLAARSA
jgi:uncharacterized membrane protein YccC